jgi:hypothetical protein
MVNFRRGDQILKNFAIELKPILKKSGLLFLTQENASGENLHLEMTICEFKITYLLA